MSWGTELWDQFDNIAVHTQKGLEFCEKYAHFIKERIAIEKDYAAKLKRLVKNYQPKKKEEDEYQFTYTKGFLDNVNELFDLAGQHETIAENLNINIIVQVQNLLQELKQERKKYLQDGARQMSALQAQLAQLEKSKKQYEKAFKESEKAQELHKKADADINLSRAEVEKAKNISLARQQYCEDCKNEYASELQKTNDSQKEHYNTKMPSIFQQLQSMEEGRICKIQTFIRQSADVERDVLPIINSCIDGMVRAADSISYEKDSRLVIERHKSGLQPPGDIPFEDLSGGMPMDNHNHRGSTPKPNPLSKETFRGTISGGKSKKRGGLLGIFSSSKMVPRDRSLRGSLNGLFRTDDSKEDYSHLPPNQQKRKLTGKIEQLRRDVAKETAERDGMLKMRDVYLQNPALGDALSLDKQLAENATKLDKLRQELSKFEAYLVEADSRLSGHHGHSYSDESITRSMSEVSVSSQPSTPQQPHQVFSSESPDSGVENRGSFTTDNHKEDSFEDDLEELPVIGKAKALYGFDGQNESSISMVVGEEFGILEEDMNDGWTRVRKVDTGEEGYVPTSYVEVTIFGK